MQIPTIERRVSDARPWGVSPGEAEGVRLEPRDAPLQGTVLRGMLLMVLTLGIYRFWYKTNLRRYYWHNTRLLDDGFEYTGTGRELFVGFLFALAVLAPFYLSATIATLMAGPDVGQWVGFAVGFVVMPAFVQIASYRARRYRLSRTRYRGIRFSQIGTGRAYLLHSLKWLLLAIVTLGICLPQMRTALYRYRMNNTFFGTVQAHFSGDAKPLMQRWMMVWGAIVGAFALVVAISASAAANIGGALVVFEIIAALAVLATIPFLWVAYRVAEFRHFTNHSFIGNMKLASDLRAKPVIWVMVKFGLMLLALTITVGMFVALTAGAAAGLGGSGLAVVVGALLPLGVMLLYMLVTEIYLRVRLWRLHVGSVAITNTAELRNILQQEGQQESGFAEAFDSGFEIAG
jgi:uncharacterized membrane protein YjgN (DUF898 family)